MIRYTSLETKRNKQKDIITLCIPKLKIINIKIFLSKHIIMVKLTTYEVKLIAKNRGIKNYQSMSKEKLLSALDKSERITENLSKNKLRKS